MATEKENALIILFQVTSTDRTKQHMRKAGVPLYNCVKYPRGSIPGCILTKGYYDLNKLYQNRIFLTSNDRKIVRANKDNKKCKGYLVFGRHWISKENMIYNNKTIRDREYLPSDHPLVIKLKERVHIIRKQYMFEYNLCYVLVSIQLPHLLNLMNGTKNFEYRNKFKHINNKYETEVKEEMDSMMLQRDNFMKKRYIFTSKKPDFAKAAVVVKYIYDMQEGVHSLIQQKARLNTRYDPLLDGEILSILLHLKQFKVTKDDILGAKPLIVPVRDYIRRKFTRLHRKSIPLLRSEYKPGIADQYS